MMSLSSSIGTGEYASTFENPSATVLRAASTSAWLESYSAMTPCSGWLDASVCCMVIRLDFGLRQERFDLEDRNHRHEAQKEQEQRQEQSDRSEERHEVPHGRVIHAPRRGQEVAVERRHDDDEALQPHADVHDDRHDE